MAVRGLFLCLLVLAIPGSCHKSDSGNNIDVSQQWKLDALGNLIGGTVDDQWHLKIFNAQEISLFNSLDTADLTGTVKPDAVIEGTGIYTFPNPFSNAHILSIPFSTGYAGDVVLKVVYVDSRMNPVFKSAVRLHATPYPPPNYSRINVAIGPSIPIGRFRLYYTLSAENNPHFYESWGNIEKTQ